MSRIYNYHNNILIYLKLSRNLPESKIEKCDVYHENLQNQIKQNSTNTSNVMVLMVVAVMYQKQEQNAFVLCIQQ